MTRFTQVPIDGPLSEQEWQPFVAWARGRPGFRDCQTPTPIEGWTTTYHRDCCLGLIQGSVVLGSRLLTLPELVSRWRELGRPGPDPRGGPRRQYGPPRPVRPRRGR